MSKKEANFTILFRHWLKANPMYSGAFELKQTINALPFSDVKDHQIEALMAVKSSKGLLHKISDETRGIKPFDMFYLINADAFVVIKYPSFFVLIDPEDFVLERDILSKRKSLTGKRAKEIASLTVDLSAKRL
jgi:hypothetical protein